MKDLKKFFSEIQMLKRLPRIGFKLAGVQNPDTLAEHALITAQIAFVLAEMEGADPYKTAALCLFHDNHEARIGDHHKVSARYLDTHSAEKKAETEHLENLPEEIAKKIGDLLDEQRNRNTKEGIVAQDADWLEVAMQAKIFTEQGYDGCQNWIHNVRDALETRSAKAILEEIIVEPDFTNIWWQSLKKMTYKKLNTE